MTWIEAVEEMARRKTVHRRAWRNKDKYISASPSGIVCVGGLDWGYGFVKISDFKALDWEVKQ